MATIRTRTRVALDLEPQEIKRLRASAAENERTLAAEVRLAVRDYLDKLSRGKRS